MGDLQAFAADCRTTARQLRRLPAELRKDLAAQVQTDVAVPLAARIASAATGGPWGQALAAGTKARKLAEPTIVVGGARPRLSGGAGPRQVVYGREFGGGSRVTAVPARAGRRGYRRRSTRQFARNRRPFVFSTISRSGGWILDTFADAVDVVLGRVMRGG